MADSLCGPVMPKIWKQNSSTSMNQGKRSQAGNRSRSPLVEKPPLSRNLVMGQVKILKRSTLQESNASLLGLHPNMVPVLCGPVMPMIWKQNSSTSMNHGKRSQAGNRSRSPLVEKPPLSRNLVMGQVKILKRPTLQESNASLLGLHPNMVPVLSKQTKIKLANPNRATELYAGSSVCLPSPPPSALPIPSFLTKEKKIVTNSSTDKGTTQL